jgi:NAD(P)-dependent dehydrogenase (short-subunit alcohol dehydrogenase family)
MLGTTCVVTGASSGIGLEVARGLARRGARVVLLGRDAGRTAAAVESILGDVPSAELESVLADLSTRAAVHAAAEQILDRCPRLDVLVNNAGAFFLRRRETSDGVEAQLAVNHLAPFLLTQLLLARLESSAPARVVNVGSRAHFFARLDFDDLQARRSYGRLGFDQYARTKLLSMLTTRALAKRLAGTGVTVNCVHPGDVATRIWPAPVRPLMKALMRSPAEGARTPLKVATDPALADVTGAYFSDEQIAEPSAAARDDEVMERAWEASLRLVGR